MVKNPWDFGNAGLIKQLIPHAKIVFIHRGPRYVLSSMYRLTAATITRPDPYTALLHKRYRRFRDSPMLQVIARQLLQRAPRVIIKRLVARMQRSCARYLRSLAAIPETDRIDVRYETLCHDTNASMQRILSYLDEPAARCDFSQLVSVRAGCLADPVANARQLVEKQLGVYAAAVGYEFS